MDLFKPRGAAAPRNPTDNTQQNGQIVNTPRFSQMGGLKNAAATGTKNRMNRVEQKLARMEWIEKLVFTALGSGITGFIAALRLIYQPVSSCDGLNLISAFRICNACASVSFTTCIIFLSQKLGYKPQSTWTKLKNTSKSIRVADSLK